MKQTIIAEASLLTNQFEMELEVPTCFECMSLSSFGHSGFTGNLTWADPESGLIYVFLSNRVYPDAENHKLITMNIRTEVMQVITDALELKFPLEAQ